MEQYILWFNNFGLHQNAMVPNFPLFFIVLSLAFHVKSKLFYVTGCSAILLICCAGFVEVSSACCGNGPLGGTIQCGKEGYTLCKNPNRFLFWDYFHPTEHTCKLLAKALWAGGQLQIRPFNLKTLASLKTHDKPPLSINT